jgi:RES domain
MAPLNPMHVGMGDFYNFAATVKGDLRYFRSNAGRIFLDDVLASAETRTFEVTKGEAFWRARLGNAFEDVQIGNSGKDEVWVAERRPYPPGGMKPESVDWTSEGRVNPRGIAYLYLATNRNTALAEVRPWIGSSVSVGEFMLTRNIRMIDCSKFHDKTPLSFVGPGIATSREDGMWLAIDKAFAKPVGRNDDVSDYIPTQILAELFKANGYDGVVYKSLLDKEGFNIALFSKDDVEQASCSLFQVSKLEFEFVDEHCTYYVDRAAS